LRRVRAARAPCVDCAQVYFQRRCSQGVHGIGDGATATAIVISPWGKRQESFQSGNQLHFYRLEKWSLDAWLYVIAQFLAPLVCHSCQIYVRGALGNHAVRYAVTVPGAYGSTCRVRGRIGDLFLSDDHCIVRHQSEETAPYTA